MTMLSDNQMSTLIAIVFFVVMFVFLWRMKRAAAAERKMENRPNTVRDSVLLFLSAVGLIIWALPILWFGPDYGFPGWLLKLVVAGVPFGIYLIFLAGRHRRRLGSMSEAEKHGFYRDQAQMKRWSEKQKLKGQ